MLRVARLAVAEHAQRRGIGKGLLRFALDLAQKTAEEVGCVGVIVDAKPEAQAFYLKYGFERFVILEGGLLDRPEPTPLFLPLSAIPQRHPLSARMIGIPGAGPVRGISPDWRDPSARAAWRGRQETTVGQINRSTVV